MPDAIECRPAPWTTVILLCGKCSKKMKAGYGPKGKESLRAALNVELKAKGARRTVRVIETGCMGLCPKKAVAALNAGRPSTILTIPRGAGPEDVLARLTAPAWVLPYGN